MDGIGYGGSISLAPETTDVRAWQWRGHKAEVRYTYHLDFPYDLASAASAVRRNIRKAQKAGYTIEVSRNTMDVLRCLHATERRQQFSYGMTQSDLNMLESLLGTDRCRFYVARSPDGEIAATRIILHSPGGRAIDWISGTTADHLTSATPELCTRGYTNPRRYRIRFRRSQYPGRSTL
jgi:hypothetical protein